MRTIEEVLALYQPAPLALPRCPVHRDLIKPSKSFCYTSSEYGVSACVDHVGAEFREIPRGKKAPQGAVFVLYTDDLGPLDPSAPGPLMTGPLRMVTSNAYNWHALRMNAAALLSGKGVLRLHLQQLSWGNAIHFPRYNPELIRGVLIHYAAALRAAAPAPAPLAPPPQATQKSFFN